MTFPDRGFGQVSSGSDWRRPRFEAAALPRYIETVRERFWMIAITVLVTLLAAGAYLATADKVYEAEADMLVTPVPSDDPVLAGLGLIRDSNDPTRDVETAARLVTTRDVALRVKQQLNLPGSPRGLLDKVKA